MNHGNLSFLCITLALALGACDGGTTTGTDAGTTTGSDSGTTMGSDSGTTMGSDSGTTTGDDAGSTLGEPAQIDITFGGCTDFTPCGGDPTGTWDYTAICIEDPFAALRGACGDITFEDVEGTARGRVTLDGATATRNVTVTTSATAIFGATCAIAGCGPIQTALAAAVDSASCAANAGGGCDCAISQTGGVAESSAYRVEGTQVITEDGTYDFCVSGGSMQHRETGDEPDEPGIYGLSRR